MPVEPRKVDRPDDPTFGEGIAVAVFDIGDGIAVIAECVADEWNGVVVAAKGRAGQEQAHVGGTERVIHAVAPGAVVGRVMNLIEHRNPTTDQFSEMVACRCRLGVGHDHPMHVRRHAALRVPIWIEM